MTRSRTSNPSSSRSRDGSSDGDGGGKRFAVFDFSEEDDRVEKVSRSLLGKFSSRRTSSVTKHHFIQCFAKNAESLSRNLYDELIYLDDAEGKLVKVPTLMVSLKM